MVDWPSYNESLVRRGQVLLDFDVLDGWDHELSQMRATREDKFVDLAICYEALFSKTDDSSDSVTHKLALRYERLIGNDFGDRIRCYREMKKLYGERSLIMHGNPLKRDIHLEEMEQNIRNAIKAYLPYYELNLSHDAIIDEIEFN
jgi:hypothetical protein